MNKIFAIGILGILCLSMFLASAPMVSAQSSSDEWPMYHHDLSHSGLSASDGPTTNALLWNFTTSPYGTIRDSAPAVANGKVYFGANDLNFYCVNAQTGTKAWNFTTGSVDSAPSVVNGYVYFGSSYWVNPGTETYSGNLYCLNAQTGAQAWSYPTAASVTTFPAVYNGHVYFGCSWQDYFGTMYSNLTCVDAITGAYLWSFNTPSWINAVGSPVASGGYVYFGTDVGDFYCLNASTGSKVWSTPETESWVFAPTVANGYVYYGTYDNTLFCRNAITGASVWNYTTGGSVYSCPAIANGNVYFGAEDNKFYCLNALTGAKVWSFTADAYVFSGAVSANGYVYFGSNDKNVYCLNAQTGALVWKYTTGGSIVASPAIANGTLYAVSWDKNLYAFGGQGTNPTTLTLTASASSATPGQQLTLSGTISPSASGNVALTVSINGSASQQIANPSLSNDAYSYQYTIQGPGTYVFQASFAGNSQLSSAQSSTYTVNVGQTAGTDYTDYLIVIIVIIIALVLIILWSRRRNLAVTVQDSQTLSPIPGASVSASGPQTLSGTTNNNGKIVFGNPTAGDYSINASATGYNTSIPVSVSVKNKTSYVVKLDSVAPKTQAE